MNRSLALATMLLAATACGTKIDPVQQVDYGPQDVPPAGITWCKDIQPMMARFCITCHDSTKSGADRQGAPTGLDYDMYAAVSTSALAVKATIQNGSMPPGGSVPTVDQGLFVEWIDTGKRECGADTSEDIASDVPDVPAAPDIPVVATCTSGKHWTQADGQGFQMSPGGNCITCHLGKANTPSYMLAGTVMGGLHDEDDCDGVLGVLVVIEDGSSPTPRIRTYTTNAAGNFFLETGSADITLPYKAHLSGGTTPRAMNTPQTDLNCADCHTVAGLHGAPGRVLAPQ